jgi:hypothetical protein
MGIKERKETRDNRKQRVACHTWQIEMHVKPRDRRIDNKKISWDLMGVRSILSILTFDHERVEILFVGLRRERANMHVFVVL